VDEDHPRADVEYLTSAEVAKRLRVSQRTIHRWADSGLLPPAWRTLKGRHGRWYWPDVQARIREIEDRDQ
jgi:excisionase family DNA binding protein